MNTLIPNDFISPEGVPSYMISVSVYDNYKEMIDWCKETFGDNGKIWWTTGGIFVFYNDADRVAFMLRWA